MKKLITSAMGLMLCALLIPLSAFAQNISVTGVVVDENNEPIPGAFVMVQNTTTGTVTDLEGNYSINATADAVLEVSYMGYVTETVPVEGKNNITVVLHEDHEALDATVVIGYGTVKKSDLTGSVVSANIKDFEKAPNVNLLQSLQGTVPGLNIGQVNSAGASPSISIRGKNTISGNTSVLIILDGVFFTGDLSSLNPNDIESIDILKDASATAVYGAQAANGVLLITTKKGNDGRPKITFSSSYSFLRPTRELTTMNREQVLQWNTDLNWPTAYTKESGYTQPNPDFNLAKALPDVYMRDSEGNITSTDYNWYENFTRTGQIWENKISISGGTPSVSYLLSYDYTTQKNYLLNDDFKRNAVRANIDATPRKWLKVGLQAFASFMNRDGQETYLPYLVKTTPLAPCYDENGEMLAFPMRNAVENPFHGAMVDDYDRQNQFFMNFYTEIQLPVKGLTYRLNYGHNYRESKHFYSSEWGANQTGEAYKSYTSYHDWTADNILNYTRSFGKHDVTATLVYGASKRESNSTRANSTQFPRLTLGYNSLQQGTVPTVSSSAWDEALLYQMARVNYKYGNRYLVTATVRRDGFSGFAANNKSAVFPSVALAWVLSEEEWFKVDAVDQLKLRAGYGISGNQTSRYASLAKVSSEIGYVYGDGGVGALRQELASMENADLRWEKTAGLNLGLDFSLLKNRITGSIEYYNTRTNDLLYDVAIPSITGFTSISSNVGEIKNNGIEFTITSHNISTRDFEWSTTFNISHNANKVVTLTGQDNDGDGVEDDLPASGLFIGESLSAIYDYKVDGIYQLDDEIPTGFHPGNYRVVDVTGEGVYNEDDRTIVGYADPIARMGLMNRFRYKNFTFSFYINSMVGDKNHFIAKNSHYVAIDDNAKRDNRFTEQADLFWSPRNPDGIYARAEMNPTIQGERYERRDFVRLQDVTLSYTLPERWTNSIGINNVNVFVNGKNLLTLTGWHGWDPETGSNYDGRPTMKSVTCGLSVTF